MIYLYFLPTISPWFSSSPPQPDPPGDNTTIRFRSREQTILHHRSRSEHMFLSDVFIYSSHCFPFLSRFFSKIVFFYSSVLVNESRRKQAVLPGFSGIAEQFFFFIIQTSRTIMFFFFCSLIHTIVVIRLNVLRVYLYDTLYPLPSGRGGGLFKILRGTMAESNPPGSSERELWGTQRCCWVVCFCFLNTVYGISFGVILKNVYLSVAVGTRIAIV